MAAKKTAKPSVSVNLDLFKAIRAKEAEMEELRNNKIETFMGEDGDGDTLIINVFGELMLSSYEEKIRGKREDNMIPNPNFKRTNWTTGMIYETLPEEWQKAIKLEDVGSKLVQMWKGQGNEVVKKADNSEAPKLEKENQGWLTCKQGVGLAGFLWGFDTSKMSEITEDEEDPEAV